MLASVVAIGIKGKCYLNGRNRPIFIFRAMIGGRIAII